MHETQSRPLEFHSLPLPENAEIARPESAVAQFDKLGSVDVGMLCYSVRDRKKRCGYRGIGVQVDPKSFLPGRRALVRRLVSWISQELTTGNLRPHTVRNRAHHLIYAFMSWADENGYHDALESGQASARAFRAFVGYLRERVARQEVLLSSAAVTQNTVCAGLSDFHAVEAKSISRGVLLLATDENSSSATLPPPEVDQAKVLALCTAIFDGLSDFVLDSQPYPFKLTVPSYLEYPDDGLWIFPTTRWCMAQPLNRGSRVWSGYSYDTGRALGSAELKAQFPKSRNSAQTTKNANALTEKANLDFRHPRRVERAVAAQNAFFVLFLANTGLNLQQAIDMPWEDEPEIQAERQGFRTLKWRANGKQVACEVQVNFLPALRKFFRLRQYLLNGRAFGRLFFTFGLARDGVPHSLTGSHVGSIYKGLRQVDPKLPAVYSRQWRAALSDWALRNRDPATAARLLQNQERTVLKSYAAGSPSKHLEEMSDFFDQVSATVLSRGTEVAQSTERAVGLCTDFGKPRATGDVPVATDCRKPEGCLFCSKYRIHADEKDTRKLLSCLFCMKKVSHLATTAEEHERLFGPIFDRIEKLLDEIARREEGLVQRISEEVERGELDAYWSSKLEFLINLELV